MNLVGDRDVDGSVPHLRSITRVELFTANRQVIGDGALGEVIECLPEHVAEGEGAGQKGDAEHNGQCREEESAKLRAASAHRYLPHDYRPSRRASRTLSRVGSRSSPRIWPSRSTITLSAHAAASGS